MPGVTEECQRIPQGRLDLVAKYTKMRHRGVVCRLDVQQEYCHGQSSHRGICFVKVGQSTRQYLSRVSAHPRIVCFWWDEEWQGANGTVAICDDAFAKSFPGEYCGRTELGQVMSIFDNVNCQATFKRQWFFIVQLDLKHERIDIVRDVWWCKFVNAVS